MLNKKKLISIIGPTAIGKTGLSILLAEKLNTEILSCDSRQFYKEIPIGTAIPTQEERKDIPHHCLEHLSIQTPYSVGAYEEDALQILTSLFKHYDTLIMVGGSGLYERAINEGLDDFPSIPIEVKEKLNYELTKYGIEFLQEKLKTIDPQYYYEVDLYNPQRLIRALEVCEFTGKPFSAFRSKNKKVRDFESLKIGLTAEREVLYARINERVDCMIEKGLVKEAQNVFPYKHLNALQTVGYRELFEYFEGNYSLEFALEEIKKNTRRYAKRQLTWYRRDSKVQWFDFKDTKNILRQF